MPRKGRIIVPQYPHHITQRGNNRQYVFQEQSDYKKYCEWINEYAVKYGMKILAYALMSNHVHFIVIPETSDSIVRVFNLINMRYAQYWNRKRSTNGHVWQGRYFSCLLDKAHLYRAVRYVENNPVRARIVKRPWDYIWSSCRTRVGKETGAIIKLSDEIDIIAIKQSVGCWQDYLLEDDALFNKEIRLRTAKGLVLGVKEFVDEMEIRFKQNFRRISLGRPKKGS